MKKNSTKKYIVEIESLKFNEAISIQYQRELMKLKKEMIKEYNTEILKSYKDNLDYIVGDENAVDILQSIINRIGEKWQLRFFLISNKYATKIIKEVDDKNKKRFTKIKKNHPFLLKSTENREQITKVLESSIAENVGLIKSIPKKYHDDILGDVMRSVSRGGDIKSLYEDLSKRSNQTSKRIHFIARDQVAKATALIDRQRAIETGLTSAIWKKSIAGKTHRKDHAAANNKEFDVSKGCYISGEYILPRMKPNCKCSYKLVIKMEKTT